MCVCVCVCVCVIQYSLVFNFPPTDMKYFIRILSAALGPISVWSVLQYLYCTVSPFTLFTAFLLQRGWGGGRRGGEGGEGGEGEEGGEGGGEEREESGEKGW